MDIYIVSVSLRGLVERILWVFVDFEILFFEGWVLVSLYRRVDRWF